MDDSLFCILDPCISDIAIRSALRADYLQAIGDESFTEDIVTRAWHHDIDAILFRDKTSIPYGSKKSPVSEKIFNIIINAESVDSF